MKKQEFGNIQLFASVGYPEGKAVEVYCVVKAEVLKALLKCDRNDIVSVRQVITPYGLVAADLGDKIIVNKR